MLAIANIIINISVTTNTMFQQGCLLLDGGMGTQLEKEAFDFQVWHNLKHKSSEICRNLATEQSCNNNVAYQIQMWIIIRSTSNEKLNAFFHLQLSAEYKNSEIWIRAKNKVQKCSQ